jgi:hypothetical protein
MDGIRPNAHRPAEFDQPNLRTTAERRTTLHVTLTIDDRPSLIPELTKNANGNATPDHIVVMLENRSFDPVVGYLQSVAHPIDGIDAAHPSTNSMSPQDPTTVPGHR